MKMPRFTQAFIDRHGNARFYFRRPGFKRVPLPGLPWSPEFMAAYEAAMAGQAHIIAAPRAKQGSFAALAASYFASSAFMTMKPSTKGVYRNAIDRLCRSKNKDGNEIGGKSAATLQREHVVKLMAARAQKPESANLLRKVLRAMMTHAVESGLRADDPTLDVKAIRVKSDGFHSWTDAEIARFEAHHAVGSPPRLALLLCTGQRRSDVVDNGQAAHRQKRRDPRPPSQDRRGAGDPGAFHLAGDHRRHPVRSPDISHHAIRQVVHRSRFRELVPRAM